LAKREEDEEVEDYNEEEDELMPRLDFMLDEVR